MAKGKKSKKKNFKLRRQIRKTFGCLFMISALIVTAIPVTPTAAAEDEGWNTADDGYFVRTTASTIPHMDDLNTPVYQDGTARFRFVYVDSNGHWDPKNSSSEKSAVIVGYDRNQELPGGGRLTIPSNMDAYVKVWDFESTYAAANRNGKPLFYVKTKKVTEIVQVTEEQTKPGGGTITVTVDKEVIKDVFDSIAPCTVEDKDKWSPEGEGDVQLYYYDANNGSPDKSVLTQPIDKDTNWKPIDNSSARITGAEVKYIGNQYAELDDKDNRWKLADKDSDENHSVFGGSAVSDGGGTDASQGAGMAAGNIVQLTIGSNLIGIGKYAFNNCVNIKDVQLGNGLNSLEDYAFANCRNLNTVSMDFNTNLPMLGAYAFSNCEQLQSFEVPTLLEAIGDFCFQNCSSLKSIKLTDKGVSYGLRRIGYKAFENCSSLERLELPGSYDGAEDQKGDNVFHLSTVRGCISLKSISTPSQRLRFVSDAPDADFPGGDNDGSYPPLNGRVDGSYSFERFMDDVGDEFYFEAPGYMDGSGNRTKTPVHNIANVRRICFKYYGQDRYEIVEPGLCRDEADPNVGLAYEVNSAGELNGFRIEDTKTGLIRDNVLVPDIVVPRKIGPHTVKAITTNPDPSIKSFSENCGVEKVTLPDTIESIGNNAFKGCHNLEHIIFGDTTKITSLGDGAFATQIVSHANCNVKPKDDGAEYLAKPYDYLKAKPFLSFTGAIQKEDGTNTEPFKYAMKSTSKINAGEQLQSYVTYYSGMPTNLAVKYNPERGMSELQYFPTKEDVENGFKIDGGPSEYEGAYKPADGKSYYRFPYMTPQLEIETMGAFNGSSENQVNIKNGAENIVVPNGVNSIQLGLFSGLNTGGFLVGVTPDTLPTASGNVAYKAPGADVKTITVQSVAEIEPFTFARMAELTTAYINGATTIGNYAFDECQNLTSAEIGPATTTLGLRPFSGCDKLTEVNFPGNDLFVAEDGIIYGVEAGTDAESGEATKIKRKIIECLEGRGSTVGSRVAGPDEFSTIKEIAPEAFMDCDSVRQVDLSSSEVKEIPEKCFAEMDNLNVVILPGTAAAIRDGAFWNTKSLASVTIPNNVIVISPDAFAHVPKNEDGTYGTPTRGSRGDLMSFDFIANPDSTADLYAGGYPYIDVTQDDSLKAEYKVYLYDAVDQTDPKFVKEYRLKEGDNYELDTRDIPDHTEDGYEFDRLSPGPDIYNPIVADTEIFMLYKPIGAKTYTVRFFDINKEEMTEYTQQVVEGGNAKPPAKSDMEIEGQVFLGWDREYTNITNDLDLYAQYTTRAEGLYYITFWTDETWTEMIGKVQEVKAGESAIEPAHPTKEGYTFSRWSSDEWQNVTRDRDIWAVYTEGSGDNPTPPTGPFNVSFYTDSDLATRIGEVQVVAGGASAVEPEHPTKEGFTFSKWSTDEWKNVTKDLEVYAVYTDNNGGGNGGNGDSNGGGGGDDNNDDDNNNSASDNSVSNNGVKYKVTVNGGSGSGEYTAGTIVPINAYARADGTVFDKWTSSSNGVGFVNQTAISTTFTMPSNDVTIEANFKKGSSSSSSVSGNSRNVNRNSTTTVDVSKGGISNTDIASANVNGSSDNFVIRITDDATATAAVIAALEAKYGDISNIAYLPMDISLYDAAGTTKITDVSGITVDITLPLPDDLIQYAGNNRVASVVNGRLEDLDTRFTTIDGIPCVQFTATHFSPYTIYVDTAHLSAGTIDATPKTGDPIHPKWFLAMGLACISIVLFCKKDKQPKVKRA